MNDPLENRATLLKAASVLLILFALMTSILDGQSQQSADLLAMWLAGDFLATGQPDQVYPVVDVMFDMVAPSEWLSRVAQIDPEGRLFPYIYPPIWAKLVSFVTPWASFAAFDGVMMVVHQTMLLWGVILAVRLCDLRATPLWLAVALTYAGLVLTMPVGIALGENQPQILVSFLIVAAFSRAHSGHLRSAGLLLALAASIKVYPLLFIVIFIGRRQWRALTSFAVAGAALGVTSILLAGWPLHAEYLHLLGKVSRSVIVSTFSFSIDAAVAIFMFADQLVAIDQPNPMADAAGWSVVLKTPNWVAVSGIAQIGALIGIAFLAAKRPNDPLILPLAAMVVALLSPLSWAYTYLTAFFFLAGLTVRLGKIGVLLAVAFFAAFHPSIASVTLDIAVLGVWAFWAIGVGVVIALAAAFAVAVIRH